MAVLMTRLKRSRGRFQARPAEDPDRGWQIVENGQHVIAWTPSQAVALFISQALSAYWEWLRTVQRVQSWRAN